MHYTLCQSFSRVNAGMQEVPEPSNQAGSTASKYAVQTRRMCLQGKDAKHDASTVELKLAACLLHSQPDCHTRLALQ